MTPSKPRVISEVCKVFDGEVLTGEEVPDSFAPPRVGFFSDDPKERAESWGHLQAYQERWKYPPRHACEWTDWWTWKQTVSVDPDIRGHGQYDTLQLKVEAAWKAYLGLDELVIRGNRIACGYNLHGLTMPVLKRHTQAECYTLAVPHKGYCRDVEAVESVLLVGYIKDPNDTPADDLKPPRQLKELVEKYR